MAELPHIIPFFALRAFSFPLDYRVPKVRPLTKEMYHAFIEAITFSEGKHKEKDRTYSSYERIASWAYRSEDLRKENHWKDLKSR